MDPTVTAIGQNSLLPPDLKARVSQLGLLIETVRTRLQTERESGIPDETQLRHQLNTAQAEYDRLKATADKAKALAKRRKSEIDEWKQWYYSLPGLDKGVELEKLNREIAWRGAEIDTLQTQIAGLETSLLEANGLVETLKHKLEALASGAYLLPVEQDPRLVGLQEEYEQAVADLQRGQP